MPVYYTPFSFTYTWPWGTARPTSLIHRGQRKNKQWRWEIKSAAWSGTYELRPAVKKSYISSVKRFWHQVYRIQTRPNTPPPTEMKRQAKPPKKTQKNHTHTHKTHNTDTRTHARAHTHTHTKHTTQTHAHKHTHRTRTHTRLTVRRFRMPRILETHGIS